MSTAKRQRVADARYATRPTRPSRFANLPLLSGTSNVPTTPWGSILVAAGCGFVQSLQFSVFFSSMWPYLKQLDASIVETFFGAIVSMYSLAQCIAGPVFGWWSNRVKNVRQPMYAGLSCMFVGNLIYLTLDSLPLGYVKWGMLLGRFVTGFGSGNVSLLRAYASTASTTKDRARAIAFVTGGLAFGTTVGPAFQLALIPLGWPGVNILGFTIHMYNAPAILACFGNMLGVVFLTFYFEEKYAGLAGNEKKKKEDKGDGTNVAKKTSQSPYDITALVVCNITRFTQMFVHVNLETIGSPFSMLMFDFTKAEAVKYNSMARGAIGAFALSFYLLFITFDLAKYMNMRFTCLVSLGLLIGFHAVTYLWPFYGGSPTMFTNQELAQSINESKELVGCNVDVFSWCKDASKLDPWVFYVSYVLCMGIAFPTLNICVTTLYSKIIGPRRQGTLQGILQTSGASARLGGPLIMSSLYTIYGPKVSWIMEVAVVVGTLSSWVIFFDRMTGLPSAENRASDEVEEGGCNSNVTILEKGCEPLPHDNNGNEVNTDTTTTTTVRS